MTGPSGLLVVDKPAGWTSHDVVAKLRGVLSTRKVGHAGTLDPDATGVLVVGVGSVTRLLRWLSASAKSYVGEVVLGVETTTLDASGEVVATHDMAGVTEGQVRAAAASLTGDLQQIPPMVSAVQVGGKRLHELARAGIEVERAPRPVRVDRFDVEPTDDPLVWRIAVDCSAGTYIRSLAADLGHALGGGAHLRHLRRTRSGSFTIADAVPLDTASVDRLLPPAQALRHLDAATVAGDTRTAVGHGKVLPPDVLGVTGDGPWRILDPRGELLAVYERHKPGTVKPAVVLRSPGPNRDSGAPVASQVMATVVRHPGGECPRPSAGCAVTIGSYDGVHRGHRVVIAELRDRATALGLATAVVTFDRHPAQVVRPDSAPLQLTDLEQEVELLDQTGVDHIVVVTFDEERSREPAEDFVREVLVGCLNAKLVIVGSDFHFGHQRRGNVGLLAQMGAELGFAVEGMALVDLGGDPAADPAARVSSTKVRQALAAGDLAAANEMLGRPHEVRGTLEGDVVLVAATCQLPAAGHYAAWFEGTGGSTQPVVAAPGEAAVAVRPLDGDVLGAPGDRVRIRFVERLAGEEVDRARAVLGLAG